MPFEATTTSPPYTAASAINRYSVAHTLEAGFGVRW